MQSIILCGGRGTRISSIWDKPKYLLPIHGRPFIEYLLLSLTQRGVTSFILATGYRKDLVREAVRDLPYDIKFSEEDIPLGTGGAVKNALRKADQADVVICNGDTFFDADLHQMMLFHREKDNRFITAAIKEWPRPFSFTNGGLYIVNKKSVGKKLSYGKSFEDIFIKHSPELVVYRGAYFVDIGTPETYAKAQVDFIKLE